MKNQIDYYNQQYNARAMVPDTMRIFTRWVQESAHVRRGTAGLFDLGHELLCRNPLA